MLLLVKLHVLLVVGVVVIVRLDLRVGGLRPLRVGSDGLERSKKHPGRHQLIFLVSSFGVQKNGGQGVGFASRSLRPL